MNDIETQIPPSEEQIEAQAIQALNDEQQEYEHLNKSIMQTGTFTSTIKNIASAKVWGEGQKQTTYYDLEMDNGDKINIGKKITLLNGNELSYEILEVGQQEYCKAKAWNPDYDNSSQSPKPHNKPYTKPSEPSKNASFALSYAKDLVCAHGSITGVEVEDPVLATTIYYADEMLNWLNEKS